MVQFRSLPCPLYWATCRKTFEVLEINLVHYFELRRHMNNASFSYFIVIYERRINGLLKKCSQNQVYLLIGGHVGV